MTVTRVYTWRLFPVSTAVAPTAIILWYQAIYYHFRHIGLLQMMIHVYFYTHLVVYLCTCEFVYLWICELVYLSTCELVNLFTCVLVNSWTSVLVYLCACLSEYLCTCPLVYLCTCVLVCLCSCELVYLWEGTHIHTHLQTDKRISWLLDWIGHGVVLVNILYFKAISK